MNKIKLLVLLLIITGVSCKSKTEKNLDVVSQNQTEEKVTPLLLEKVIIKSPVPEDRVSDTLCFYYDSLNRLKNYVMFGESYAISIDTIKYDDQNRIIYTAGFDDNGSPVGAQKVVKRIVYKSADEVVIYRTNSYPDASPDIDMPKISFDTTILKMKDGRFVSKTFSNMQDTVKYAYDTEGNLFENSTPTKDTVGYSNPYALVGGQLLWEIIRNNPLFGNASLQSSAGVAEIGLINFKPYTPPAGLDLKGKKYPASFETMEEGLAIQSEYIYKQGK